MTSALGSGRKEGYPKTDDALIGCVSDTVMEGCSAIGSYKNQKVCPTSDVNKLETVY